MAKMTTWQTAMFILLSIFFLVAAEARDDVSALVSSFETPLRALREDFAAQEEKMSMLTTKVADDRATSATQAKLLEGLLEIGDWISTFRELSESTTTTGKTHC